MSEELPETVRIDMASVTNREWLWLEDSCGVVVTAIETHPTRAALALKTLALRRWQAENGKPPSIGFSDVVDGTYDAVKVHIGAEENEDADPTRPVDAEV